MYMSTVFGLLLAVDSLQIEREWAETFFGLDAGQRFVLLIIAVGCATGIIISTVGMVTGIISAIHRRRLEAELKREMLDRGLTAEEISRVIESSPPKDALERWIASWGKKH